MSRIKHKSIVKTLSILLCALILVFSIPTISKANNIYNINLEVTLHQDGSATFIDNRAFNIDEGTEHYITFANLGESELIDFKVYENGVELQDVGDWDINASLEEKAGKYGVNYTSDGFELCFGVGSLGDKEFTIEYSLSNIVRNLEDGNQAIYWQMINPDMDPTDRITVSVINDFSLLFTKDTTRIWGFGYQGTTKLEDSKISMDSGENFARSDYMVLLTIFDGKPFATNSQYNYTADSLIEKAMDGATLDGMTYDDFKDGNLDESFEESSSSGSSNISFFELIKRMPFMIIPFIGSFIPFLLAIFGISYVARSKGRRKGFKVSDNVTYHRDIPYEGGFHYTKSLSGFLDSDIISAFILKWLVEERMEEITETKGLIFKKDVLGLRITGEFSPTDMDQIERKLWTMIISAAGSDGVLSYNEFNKYVSKNISTFNSWTKSIDDTSSRKMLHEGYLSKQKEKFLFVPYSVNKPTAQGQELIDNIEGFKMYLENFSLMDEREVSNVAIWDEYMIWAAYMGIADKVYEQLKIAIPNFEQQVIYTPNTIYGVNTFGRNAISRQSSANSSSSFSGGGGSSFSGGGGGASGGSSGGGSR